MELISSIAPPQGLADIEAFRAQRSENAYKAFEAMFLQVVLKEMRKTVSSNEGLFPKSQATETFEEMLDAAIARNIADSGQLGIARQLAEEAARYDAAAALAPEDTGFTGLEPLKMPAVLADNP